MAPRKKVPLKKTPQRKTTPTKKAIQKKKTPTKKRKSPSPVSSDASSSSTSSNSSSSRDCSRRSSDSDKDDVEEIGEPVIKSPLDTHGYRVVRYNPTGMQGVLVSTCLHPREGIDDKKPGILKGSCIFTKLAEFNQEYGGFETKSGAPKTTQNSIKFSKASEAQVKANKKLQKRLASKKKATGTKTKIKVICRTGVHELNDELQDFCNTKCAVVLSVRAGYFNDPPEIPGMAHFCEHCISLGSKDYPEPEAFGKFLDTKNGITNARTEPEFTYYYFYIDYEEITEALEMFGDMFVNPIFNKCHVDKEIDAVNSEFEIKLFEEVFRHIAMLQTTFVQGHPTSRFPLGSKETFAGKDMMAELQKWCAQYYCPKNMVFGIQGPESLDQLQKYFERFASKVLKKPEVSNVPRPVLTPPDPCLSHVVMSKWNRLYLINVPETSESMCISWSVHPKFGISHETKPVSYLSYILRKNEPGSLEAFLKGKGWITALAVNNPDNSFFSTGYHTIINVKLDLTSAGLDNRMEVLTAVFLYLKLLQKHKASLTIFDEIRQLQADIFHYRSDNNLSDPTIGRSFDDGVITNGLLALVEVLARRMSPKDIIVQNYMITKWNPCLLNEFIDALTPDKAMVSITSDKFTGKLKEKWFHVRYSSEPIPSNFMQSVLKKGVPREFKFPEPNPYINVSYCYPDDEPGCRNDEKGTGLVAYNSAFGEVTYGNATCKRGLLPSATYTLDFFSPALDNFQDSRVYASICVLNPLVLSLVETVLGQALSSLISPEVQDGPGFITIQLSGPSPKLPKLARMIISLMQNLDEIVRQRPKLVDDFVRKAVGMMESMMLLPEQCAQNLCDYTISWRSLFPSDISHLLKTSYDHTDFQYFIQDFKQRLFVAANLDGCVSKRHASEFAAYLDQAKFNPCSKKSLEIPDRILQLPMGERCIVVSAKNEDDATSVVINYYQIGHQLDHEQREMLRVLVALMNEDIFAELRTKQALGYFVEVIWEADKHGVMISLSGVADKHTCGSINEKIDTFIRTFYMNYFSNVKKFKKSTEEFLEPEDTLDFKKAKDFFASQFFSGGSGFRKLSIHVQGKKRDAASKPSVPTLVQSKVDLYKSGVSLPTSGKDKHVGISKYSTFVNICLTGVTEENGYFITNVQKFKNSLTCLPVDDVDEEQ